MAVRTTEEIMELIRTRVGDSTSDEDLSFIEDVNDTLSDMSGRIADTTDWKAKYEENDAAWRTKYKERFFTGDETPIVEDSNVEVKEETEEKTKYEDLFTEE